MTEISEQSDIITKSVIVAYIKRPHNQNTVVFADDPNRSDIEQLFKDPFVSMKKLSYDHEHDLKSDECWEVPLSEAAREALKRQYVLSLDSAMQLPPNKQSDEGGNDIRTLYSVGQQKIIFKYIAKSNYIRGKAVISLHDEPKTTGLSDVVAIGSEVHAVYNTLTNRFYFSDFQAAKHVFGRLEVVYRSATQDSIDEWLDPGLFNVDNDFDTFSISTPNRKKIAFATNDPNIDLEDAALLDRLASYAIRNGPGGLFENSRFNIRSNTDVTEALRLITGAYYENAITGELMIANGAKKAKKQQSPNTDPSAID